MFNEERSIGAVPTAAPSSPAGPTTSGPDPYQLIANIVDPKLVTAATSPLPGAHAQALPSSFTAPIAPHQDRPLDNREVVGRGNARAQGIQNAFTGATNALGAIVTKQTQLKQAHIKDAATKVIMAQQAIDEATQAHDAAIANGDAVTASKMQAVIQQNQQARDSIFADPKMGKALQKGFDISYTDPGSNKTEEHEAVQQALKQAKTFAEKRAILKQQQQQQNEARGKAMGAAFEKSQPQGLAPNVTAQQRLAIQQATQKELAGVIKSVQPALIKADAATQGKLIDQQTQLTKQAQQIADRNFQRQQAFQQRLQVLGIQNAYATRRLYQENSLILNREKAMLQAQDNDPDRVQKGAEEMASTWDSRQQTAVGRVDAANNALDLIRSEGKQPGDPVYDRAQTAADQASDDLEMIQDQADYSLNQFNLKLASVGRQPIPGPSAEPKTKTGDSSANTDTRSAAPGTGNNFTDYFNTLNQGHL